MDKKTVHEITSYLHQIIGNAEFIANNAEFNDYAEKIKKNAYRIDALISDSLTTKADIDISTDDSGVVDLKKFMGLNVMIIDDMDENIQIMKNIFNTLSCNTISANSGEEAIKLYKKKFKADIICMDIVMPGIDGIATTKELKALGCNAFFIAVSALKNQSHDDVSLFDVWLPKPFMFENIIGALSNYIAAKNTESPKQNNQFELTISDKDKQELLNLARDGAYSALGRFINELPDSESKDFLYAAQKELDFNLITKTILSS